jgi:hypothetical protein
MAVASPDHTPSRPPSRPIAVLTLTGLRHGHRLGQRGDGSEAHLVLLLDWDAGPADLPTRTQPPASARAALDVRWLLDEAQRSKGQPAAIARGTLAAGARHWEGIEKLL